MHHVFRTGALAGLLLGGLLPSAPHVLAQSSAGVGARLLGSIAGVPPNEDAVAPTFRSLRDSVEWATARERAYAARGERLVVSVFDRRLYWMHGPDTLFVAPVAVASGDTLSYRDRRWEFLTPRGRRTVRAKERNPVWRPPLWHYVGHAREHGLRLVQLAPGRAVTLPDASRIEIRGRRVGRAMPNGAFIPYEPGEHIAHDGVLYVPPLGTVNREIEGELGAYKLDLGEAYLIHGTPHKDSIGTAATRGCIRVGDEDLAYIYHRIRVGTPVYIY
jgi:hypothetical protein